MYRSVSIPGSCVLCLADGLVPCSMFHVFPFHINNSVFLKDQRPRPNEARRGYISLTSNSRRVHYAARRLYPHFFQFTRVPARGSARYTGPHGTPLTRATTTVPCTVTRTGQRCSLHAGRAGADGAEHGRAQAAFSHSGGAAPSAASGARGPREREVSKARARAGARRGRVHVGTLGGDRVSGVRDRER